MRACLLNRAILDGSRLCIRHKLHMTCGNHVLSGFFRLVNSSWRDQIASSICYVKNQPPIRELSPLVQSFITLESRSNAVMRITEHICFTSFSIFVQRRSLQQQVAAVALFFGSSVVFHVTLSRCPSFSKRDLFKVGCRKGRYSVLNQADKAIRK